ncbi:MAG: UbiA prenyltransferase family protein [Oscillatoriales cyanobacterium RM2_1_1]|nr:UbiA prenyltransferase family protein [Oscillatoriales cyanobacterium SM2_3_0]NJO47927.1 UbiA prenyltransferase family protein [Oscillatoriales cyanobacterium RM2_1_1]
MDHNPAAQAKTDPTEPLELPVELPLALSEPSLKTIKLPHPPNLIQLLRPHQWTKNLFCLAGVVFGGRLLEPRAILLDCLTVVVFSAMASAVYIFNDIQDIERDRRHPKKCFRPIASGQIRIQSASLIGSGLALFALLGSYSLGLATFMCVLGYGINNIAYSLKLKHIPLFDVNCIALGFVFRLLAGIYVLDDKPTAWIVLCTFFLTLFLGFAKRRAELLALLRDDISQELIRSKQEESAEAPESVADLFYLQLIYQRGRVNKQRPVLAQYTLPYLDSLLNSTATITIMCYALFTISSGKNPSLVITVPIVYYAVMHYKRVVTVLAFGEEPDQLLLKDNSIKISLLVWLISYLLILYFDLQLFK